jgi:hypothetical protein
VAQRKTDPRRRTLKPGKIVFNRRGSVIDCMVRNMSAAGACLEFPSTVGVPDRFDLVIASETHPRACLVAWKDRTRLGVTFR